MDLIKAVLIGAVLISGILMIPAIITALSMFFGFMVVVGVVWIIIMLVKEDPKPPP